MLQRPRDMGEDAGNDRTGEGAVQIFQRRRQRWVLARGSRQGESEEMRLPPEAETTVQPTSGLKISSP